MKTSMTLIAALVLAGSSFAAEQQSVKGLTIDQVQALPTKVLRMGTSLEYYQRLRETPLAGWTIVRAELSGSKLYGARIMRSDLDGAYDELALRLAKDVRISGYFTLGSQMHVSPALVHLLIYKNAEATVVVSFVNVDTPGGNQQEYYGSARTLVAKNGEGWSEVRNANTGQGIVVRSPGNENSWATLKKLEIIDGIGN